MTTAALSIPKETNPLRGLSEFGQSVWLDYIRRSLITSGELKRLVVEDGLRGVTSNPAIFEKAIVGSTDYEAVINSSESAGLDAKGLYEKIAVKDVQDAADILRPVYEESKQQDGYVSLEVSPLLAHDTAGTLEEARRLWKAVNRPNLMVKVPATPEGIPALRQLISEGINVNVTLLFSRDVYEQVAKAYIEGLTARDFQRIPGARTAAIELDGRRGERGRHHGCPGAGRHLDEGCNEHALGRRPAPVCRCLRTTAESHGIQEGRAIHSEDQFHCVHPAAKACHCSRKRAHGLAEK